MTRLQERFAHWEQRQGLVALGRLPIRDARHAVERSLPTMHRTLQVFDCARELLADRGLLDPASDDAHRVVHVRDPARPEWLVAAPLLHLAFVPTSHVAMTFTVSDPLLPEDGWRPIQHPPPEIHPRGASARSGSLTIAEGPAFYKSSYDERGLFRESSESAVDPFIPFRHDGTKPYTIDPSARPPPPGPIALLCRDDLDAQGHTVEGFARMLVELRPWERSLGRVCAPAPLPGGIANAWQRGLFALRRALHGERIGRDARFAIADGLDGTAVAGAATLEGASTAWNAELFRVKPAAPRPVSSQASPKPRGANVGKTIELTSITIGSGVPWPRAIPALVPRVLIELPAPPELPSELRAHGFERWTRVVDAQGVVSFALVRDDADGATLIGDGILDLVDPRTLDAELDAADAQQASALAHAPFPLAPASLRHYRCWDAGFQRRKPFWCSGSRGFDPAGLDGHAVRWGVTRIRTP